MFSKTTIQQVWEKATTVEGFDERLYRKDACGAWIVRGKYGDTSNPFGWEIDHIYPVALGGDDNPDNLRAMQHENNRSKGDDYPSYKCVIKADGTNNVRVERVIRINRSKQERIKTLYGL